MLLKKANANQLFVAYEVYFESIHKYIHHQTDSGDYIIPLTSQADQCFEKITKDQLAYDEEDYVNTFDTRLLRFYRHQDTSLVLKNIKKFGENEGLLDKVQLIIIKADALIRKFPKVVIQKIANTISEGYDKLFKDPTTNHVPKLIIWIPVWKINADKAIEITILDRIKLLFS